jgi:hypothetical protein
MCTIRKAGIISEAVHENGGSDNLNIDSKSVFPSSLGELEQFSKIAKLSNEIDIGEVEVWSADS